MLVCMWIHQAEGLEYNPNSSRILKNLALHSISSQLATKLSSQKFYSHFYVHIEPHALLFLTVKRQEGKQIPKEIEFKKSSAT